MSQKTMIKRGFGWRPDVPDARDHCFAAARRAAKLPAKVDLRAGFPAVYDQGQLGSCTANAIAAAVEFDRKKQKLPRVRPSRLFIYYNERDIEGTVDSDAGATIRDSVKAVDRDGYCPESAWAYDVARFAAKPGVAAYAKAVRHKGVSYQRVGRTLDEFRACLAGGFPFVLGISVYESFESAAVAKSGHAPAPADGEEMLGGHAVVCVGYDDAAAQFTFRNSWGGRWGMKGYFTLPYRYLLNANLSDDFWTVSLVN